jgi:hypothetical protein
VVVTMVVGILAVAVAVVTAVAEIEIVMVVETEEDTSFKLNYILKTIREIEWFFFTLNLFQSRFF